jgi:spore coat polysaccharide biosynthesis protein SpsF (cytidylyltransferase family)
MYDKTKLEKLQVLLPIGTKERLKKILGRIDMSPFVAEMVLKYCDEEEKKRGNPEK